MKLSDFKVLSFDCYGTLIDWESGILTAMRPLIRRAGVTLDDEAILEAFAAHESAQQAATPDMRYALLLSVVHARLANFWGVPDNAAENQRFGDSIGEWPAFPDTVAALGVLRHRYRLVILSNVDRISFSGTNQRLGIAFDAVHTAQDIGSYKPDLRGISPICWNGWQRTGSRNPTFCMSRKACTTTMRRPTRLVWPQPGSIAVTAPRDGVRPRRRRLECGTTSGLRAWRNWRRRLRQPRNKPRWDRLRISAATPNVQGSH